MMMMMTDRLKMAHSNLEKQRHRAVISEQYNVCMSRRCVPCARGDQTLHQRTFGSIIADLLNYVNL
jgi:hypothetical protein